MNLNNTACNNCETIEQCLSMGKLCDLKWRPKIGQIWKLNYSYANTLCKISNSSALNEHGRRSMTLTNGVISYKNRWVYLGDDLLFKLCEDCNEICKQQCHLPNYVSLLMI